MLFLTSLHCPGTSWIITKRQSATLTTRRTASTGGRAVPTIGCGLQSLAPATTMPITSAGTSKRRNSSRFHTKTAKLLPSRYRFECQKNLNYKFDTCRSVTQFHVRIVGQLLTRGVPRCLTRIVRMFLSSSARMSSKGCLRGSVGLCPKRFVIEALVAPALTENQYPVLASQEARQDQETEAQD